MSLKQQWRTIKQNWLIALAVLVIIFVPMFSGGTGSFAKMAPQTFGMEEMAIARAPSGYYPGGNDFAPEIEERKITKTASLSTEVERGTFKDAETRLKAIVIATDSFLLNENVNQQDTGWKKYYYGSYQIKIETSKYDAVLSQLKNIGEVQSFNENAQDITGRYSNLETELELEKERLERYKEMYKEVEDVSDKIELSDRIFNQERRVQYLEEAINNLDKKIDYSTVYVNLQEKQSEYTNIMHVKFSELVRKLVNSFNGLLGLVFWAIPWAIAVLVVWIGVRFFRRK